MEAYGQDELQDPYCLAASGSKLISGSVDSRDINEAHQYKVLVWGLGRWTRLEC